MQLERIKEVDGLPGWETEAVDEASDRIDELEMMLIGAHGEIDEMYEILKFYAGEPNGQRARTVTER